LSVRNLSYQLTGTDRDGLYKKDGDGLEKNNTPIHTTTILEILGPERTEAGRSAATKGGVDREYPTVIMNLIKCA
jgi:hypothetical protein